MLNWKSFNVFGYPSEVEILGYSSTPLQVTYGGLLPLGTGCVSFEVQGGHRIRALFSTLAPDEETETRLLAALSWALWAHKIDGREVPEDWVEGLAAGSTSVSLDDDLSDYIELEKAFQAERAQTRTAEDLVQAEFVTSDSVRDLRRLDGDLYGHLSQEEIRDAVWNLLKTGGLLSKIVVRSRLDPDFGLCEYDHSSEIPEWVEDDAGNYDEEPVNFRPGPLDLDLNLMRGPSWSCG